MTSNIYQTFTLILGTTVSGFVVSARISVWLKLQVLGFGSVQQVDRKVAEPVPDGSIHRLKMSAGSI
ncbi:hypothetical protein [Desmonostoc muscorum]|uniref:hypothetical protein n=1 Tax=Desmonostoc muscorum TaxID=1179 RepID=UPI001F1DCFF8|nr:hypothetical protein [Desmonostoc muscorum]